MIIHAGYRWSKRTVQLKGPDLRQSPVLRSYCAAMHALKVVEERPLDQQNVSKVTAITGYSHLPIVAAGGLSMSDSVSMCLRLLNKDPWIRQM